MEKIEEFDWGFAEIQIPQTDYFAEFDKQTGVVTAVGPSCAFASRSNLIPLDETVALDIIEGRIPISSCSVNISSGEIEFVETRTTFKIDDVLHRIPDKKFSEFDSVDLYLGYSAEDQTMKFELSEELSGTRKNKTQSKKKKINWSGETKLNFFITEYNDPNVLYYSIGFNLADLSDRSLIFEIKSDLPEKVSVYTRRIFENYVIEYL